MTSPALRPNLPGGVFAAVVGALVGAVAWAVLVSVTDYKIGYAAIGVGALAGFAAGKVGRGAPALPPIAAVIGVLGCFVGDLLIEAHAGAKVLQTSSLSIITSHTKLLWEAYRYDFDALSGVFYVIAAVAAFRLATAHGLAHQQSAAPPAYAPPTAPPTGPPVTPGADQPTDQPTGQQD